MLSLLIAAAALLAAAPPAQEAPGRVAVHTADLNLTTVAGRQALDGRIKRAVGKLCPADASFELQRRVRVERCRTAVVAGVSAQRERAVANARRTQPHVAGLVALSTSGND